MLLQLASGLCRRFACFASVHGYFILVNVSLSMAGFRSRLHSRLPLSNKNGDGYKSVTYRAFSLTWPAYMLIYCNKRKFLNKKRGQLPQDCLGTPTWPPVPLFWNTNLAAVTSCENSLYKKWIRADFIALQFHLVQFVKCWQFFAVSKFRKRKGESPCVFALHKKWN